MLDLTTEEMISFIRNFISEMHDYDPLFNNENDDVIGCFNTKYHGNMFQSIVNPGIKEGETASYPKLIIAYVLLKDGDILLCDINLESHNLKECLGDGIETVFDNLKEALDVKNEYERMVNKKEGEL